MVSLNKCEGQFLHTCIRGTTCTAEAPVPITAMALFFHCSSPKLASQRAVWRSLKHYKQSNWYRKCAHGSLTFPWKVCKPGISGNRGLSCVPLLLINISACKTSSTASFPGSVRLTCSSQNPLSFQAALSSWVLNCMYCRRSMTSVTLFR
jgi:hypothetical protein